MLDNLIFNPYTADDISIRMDFENFVRYLTTLDPVSGKKSIIEYLSTPEGAREAGFKNTLPQIVGGFAKTLPEDACRSIFLGLEMRQGLEKAGENLTKNEAYSILAYFDKCITEHYKPRFVYSPNWIAPFQHIIDHLGWGYRDQQHYDSLEGAFTKPLSKLTRAVTAGGALLLLGGGAKSGYEAANNIVGKADAETGMDADPNYFKAAAYGIAAIGLPLLSYRMAAGTWKLGRFSNDEITKRVARQNAIGDQAAAVQARNRGEDTVSEIFTHGAQYEGTAAEEAVAASMSRGGSGNNGGVTPPKTTT